MSKRTPQGKLVLLGVGLALVIGILAMILSDVLRLDSGVALRAEQIQQISSAIKTFQKYRRRRPETLEQLIKAGMLDTESLFDERRDGLPEIDPATGRFTENPDVLYFPALRADDPGDMVLLCNLLLRSKRDKFHVIYNDGSYAALTAHELVMALNKTYKYIGAQIAKSGNL